MNRLKVIVLALAAVALVVYVITAIHGEARQSTGITCVSIDTGRPVPC